LERGMSNLNLRTLKMIENGMARKKVICCLQMKKLRKSNLPNFPTRKILVKQNLHKDLAYSMMRTIMGNKLNINPLKQVQVVIFLEAIYLI
jgi:hypothetical protein